MDAHNIILVFMRYDVIAETIDWTWKEHPNTFMHIEFIESIGFPYIDFNNLFHFVVVT